MTNVDFFEILPLEMRLAIYNFVFGGIDHEIEFHHAKIRHKPCFKLLFVCKRILEEAQDDYYRNGKAIILCWGSRIPRSIEKLLSNIHLNQELLYYCDNFGAYALLLNSIRATDFSEHPPLAPLLKSALGATAEWGTVEHVRDLKMKMENLRLPSSDYSFAVWVCAHRGYVTKLRVLLDIPQIPIKESWLCGGHKYDVLEVARSHGHIDIMQELWSYCNPQRDAKGLLLSSDSEFAVWSKNPELLCMLGHWGARLDGSALAMAAAEGRVEICELLLTRGLNVGSADREGTPALHYASYHRQLSVCDSLIQHGANVNIKSHFGIRSGCTPLHLAAAGGEINVVRLLLKHGADINAVDDRQVSPLCEAARMGNTEILREIKHRGGRLTSDVLAYACRSCKLATVKEVLSWGVEINACNGLALYTAAIATTPLGKDGRDVVEHLLSCGATVNLHPKCMYWGSTALHAAVRNKSQYIAELLVKSGADPDKRKSVSKHFWVKQADHYLLYYALQWHIISMAIFLVDSGATITRPMVDILEKNYPSLGTKFPNQITRLKSRSLFTKRKTRQEDLKLILRAIEKAAWESRHYPMCPLFLCKRCFTTLTLCECPSEDPSGGAKSRLERKCPFLHRAIHCDSHVTVDRC